MDLPFEQFFAKSSTITVFSDVDTPSPDFSTTTVSRTKEELGPGWAMDDVYPPLAELRRALMTDEEWAAMSSWEKDVWEMFYRPDWERLACIEQILVDTPEVQRAHKHQEILEALRSLGASASKPASASAANACIDVCTCASPFDTNDNGYVAEVPGQARSSPGQDAYSSSMGITTVELQREGVPEPVPMSAALQGCFSSVSILKETLGVDPSACSSFITTVPGTCSTDCLPQQLLAAPVLVASSSSTPIEYGLDTKHTTWAIATSVANESPVRSSSNTGTSDSAPPSTREDVKEMFEPMSELFDKFQDVVDSRPPRRPPELEAASGQNCVREPLPRQWLSIPFDIGPVQRESCSPFEDRPPLPTVWSMFTGSRSTSYVSIIGIVLGSPSGIYCLDDVFSFPEYWACANDCVQSTNAYHTTFVWLPCSISGFQLPVMVGSLELKLFSNGSTPISLLKVLLDSGKCAALICEYLGADITDCVGSWLFVVVCQESVQSSSDYYIAREIISGNSLILNPRRYCMMVVSNSAFSQLATAWDSGQHVSYDRLFGAFQKVSEWPGNLVTSDQMQVNGACSTRELFLSGSSISLLLVKFLVQANEPYDTELHASQLTGAKSVYHYCQLQCVEAIFAYLVYCPSFSSATEFSVWEGKKLELKSWVSYTVAQYTDQCSTGIKTGLHSLSKRTSRALIQGIPLSKQGSYRFDAIVLGYAPIHAGCAPSSICDASYSRKVALHMAARELLFLHDGIYSWADSKNMAYAGHDWLSRGFILTCLPGTMLLGWPRRDHELLFLMQAARRLLLLQNQDSDNGVAVKKQNGNLVLRMKVPWNPGGSIWHGWLSTCYDQDHFQGGRHAIALATFFEQVSTGYKYYLDSEDIRASGSCHLSAFFDWFSIGQDFYFYLVAEYPNSGYYCDSNDIKVRRLQWDPGGFTAMSAWGQAEFQGGRGVRDPTLAWAWTWAGTGTWAWAWPTYLQQAARALHIPDTSQRGRHPEGSGTEPALSLVSLLLLLISFL